jgi:hypothetical protein
MTIRKSNSCGNAKIEVSITIQMCASGMRISGNTAAFTQHWIRWSLNLIRWRSNSRWSLNRQSSFASSR